MAGGKRLDVYMDIVSLYSYVALEDLYRSLPIIAANGVHIEFHPIFLGGIMQASGNKPPWTVTAKAEYIHIDRLRSCSRVNIPNATLSVPADFIPRARNVSPLRALHHVKAHFPTATFLATLRALCRSFWHSGNGEAADLRDDDTLRRELLNATVEPETTSKKIFTEREVEEIMAGREAMRDKLTETTERALKLGAFGAPWLVATNERGEEEPFFGSDRFNFIWKFLGVAFNDVEIKAPEAKL